VIVFDDGKTKIINGEAVWHLKKMEVDSVDVVITDPPYGIGLDYDGYEDTQIRWEEMIDEFIPEALRVSKNCVLLSTSTIEGEKYLYRNFDPQWRICWYKGALNTRSPIGFKHWESIFVFGKKLFHNTPDYFKANAGNTRQKDHPCPKPLAWSDWLVKKFSNEGDIILDPFVGTGTTLVSARQMGRKGIGIDQSLHYCEIAQQRVCAEGE